MSFKKNDKEADIIAEARRIRELREQGYREQALKKKMCLGKTYFA